MAVDPVAVSAIATAPLQGSCRKGDQDFVPAAPATKASTPALTAALTNVPTWSGWTRCHSTFSFVFAPPRPGVFVLAEEVGAIESGRRMLAVVEVAQCTDLGRALSALFTGRLRDRVGEARCYVRYAVVDDREERRRIQAALARSLAPASDFATPLAAPAAHQDNKIAGNKTAAAQESTVRQPEPITSVVVSAPEFISDRDPGDESDSRIHEPNAQAARSRQGTAARAPFPAGF